MLNRYFIRPTTIDRIHASWITVADRNFLHATRPLYGANIYSSGIARITESGITPVLDTSKKQILEFQAANDGRFYVDTLSWTNTSEIDVYAPDGTFDGTLGPTFGNLDGIALEQTPAVPEPNYMGRECLAVACLGVFALVAHRRVPGAQPTQPAILGIGQQDAVVYSDSKFPAVNSSDC